MVRLSHLGFGPVSYTHLDVYKRQGQTIADCQPSINPRLPWVDAAPEVSHLNQMAPAVTGVEPNEGLAWYAWWEAGKSPARLFPPYGSPPPSSLVGDLYQPFSVQNAQFAGLNASWFWGRTFLDVYKRQDMTGRQVYIVDPMLATGGSLADALHVVWDRGATDITIVTLLAAPEGIERLDKETSGMHVTLVTAAVDERLNEQGFIVPGLGDAGDRLFGIVSS